METETATSNKPKQIFGIVIAILSLIALLAVAFFVSQSQNAKKAEARVQHDVAVGEYRLHWDELQTAITEAENILSSTGTENVANPEVLDNLQKSLELATSFKEMVPIDAQAANTEAILEDAEKFDALNSEVVDAKTSLESTFEPVKKSIEQKILDDLREEIVQLSLEADGLLLETERIKFYTEVLALRGALELAREVIYYPESTAEQLHEAKKNLSEYVAAVEQALIESEPKPEDINGHWCPALDGDASSDDCIFVQLPEIEFLKDGKTQQLKEDLNYDGKDGCFAFSYGNFTPGKGVDSRAVPASVAPLGIYCPAGVELSLPSSYKGLDYPGEDRIWSSKNNILWLRK